VADEVAVYDMTIVQGATLRKVFVWKGADDAPISLAGWTARMQVRDKPGGSVLLTSDVANGDITLEPAGATGEIHLRVGADKTNTITKSGFYDIELVATADATEVRRLIGGRAILSKQVTA
jgi:hypothetical protein